MADYPKILFKREISEITRLSHAALSQMERKNMFPRRIKIGQQRVAWIESEVREWLADRMAERNEARPVE
jgi:prophage regulatory protein